MRNAASYLQNIPVAARTDVLVVGSGPAGVAAAAAASREGARTLLVERYGCLGGALSVSMVESYCFSVNDSMENLCGIPLEIVRRVRENGGAQKDYRGEGILIDPEIYKCLLDDWMGECGVDILLHSYVCGVLKEGDTVNGAIVVNKSGFSAIHADVTIDATGDGDVAYYAKAAYEKRDRDQLMPVSTVFGISGVDMALFGRHTLLHPDPNDPDYGLRRPLRLAYAHGEWPLRKAGAWKMVTDGGEITSLNLLLVGSIDCTDAQELTRAEIEGRKQARMAIDALRKYGADIGFQNCRLRTLAPQLGLRESRRVRGVERLTIDDIVNARGRSDSVGRFPCFADNWGRFHRSKEGETFALPYGMLVPEKTDGLLTAGRCVSCDADSYGAVRMMVCCAATGQAAGTAGALCALRGIQPRRLDIHLLQERLRNAGVSL